MSKDKYIRARVSEGEYKKANQLARQRNKNVSELIRDYINTTYENDKMKKLKGDK